MMNGIGKMAPGCAALFFFCAVQAGDGTELPVNGDFRGGKIGGSSVPGWHTGSGKGAVKILRSDDAGEFILEISAPENEGKTVASGKYPIKSGILEIEAEVSGSGGASVGYELVDASGAVAASEKRTVRLSSRKRELKNIFTIRDPEGKFVRITISAEAGSVARFGDVEAEIR